MNLEHQDQEYIINFWEKGVSIIQQPINEPERYAESIVHLPKSIAMRLAKEIIREYQEASR